MIIGDALQEIICRFWAGRFDCAPGDFSRPGTLIFPDDGMGGDTFYRYRIGELLVLRIAPSSIEALGFQHRIAIDLLGVSR